MSKYNNYGQFMIAVIEEADNKCGVRFMSTLLQAFKLPDSAKNLLQIIYSIINIGWPAFVAVCGLLILGPIAFAAALIAFVAGGVGAVIIAALAIYGGIQAIKLLYKNKVAPLAIYEVGKKYKSRFDIHIDEVSYIDNLIDEASDDLIRLARE